ncbi:hypothetical protein SK128_026360, partial [Halocaridina rubra]
KHGNCHHVQGIITCNAITTVHESSPSKTDRTFLEPSRQQEPLLSANHPTMPSESVSADFFQIAGKSFM